MSMQWRSALETLCAHRITYKEKGKFYKIAIRSNIFYGTKCVQK